jgi:hypothetical protein
MPTRTLLVSALIASAIMSRLAEAQKKSAADTVTPRFTTGSTHLIAGFARFELADLDARVAAAGLPNVARSAATVGLGTDVRAGRMVFGASFQSLITQDHRNAAYRTRLGGSFTLFDVGATMLNRGGWAVTPLAGLGLTSLNVSLREIGDFTFDEALARPSRELGMSGLGGVTHVGLLVERRFHRGDAEYALAVRGGMTRSLGSQAWTSDANKVDAGPSGMRGSYLRVMFSRPMRARRDAVLPTAGFVAQAVLR